MPNDRPTILSEAYWLAEMEQSSLAHHSKELRQALKTLDNLTQEQQAKVIHLINQLSNEKITESQ